MAIRHTRLQPQNAIVTSKMSIAFDVQAGPNGIEFGVPPALVRVASTLPDDR